MDILKFWETINPVNNIKKTEQLVLLTIWQNLMALPLIPLNLNFQCGHLISCIISALHLYPYLTVIKLRSTGDVMCPKKTKAFAEFKAHRFKNRDRNWLLAFQKSKNVTISKVTHDHIETGNQTCVWGRWILSCCFCFNIFKIVWYNAKKRDPLNFHWSPPDFYWSPPYFHWRPPYVNWGPQTFYLRPQIYIGDFHIFISNPKFSKETPRSHLKQDTVEHSRARCWPEHL